MVSLTCISVFLQLISNIATKTLPPYLQTYWKTTYVTDQIPDYWNHWSIQAANPVSKKKPDVFSPWLNKITPSSTVTEIGRIHDKIEMRAIDAKPTPLLEAGLTIINTTPTNRETFVYTTVTSHALEDMVGTDPEFTTIVQQATAAERTVSDGHVQLGYTNIEATVAIPAIETAVYADYAKIYESKTESLLIPTTTTEDIPPSMNTKEEVQPVRVTEGQASMDPFSVFLQILFHILATKEVKDMPYLINQFRDYVSSLLTGGQLGELGMPINSYIATRLLILEAYPMKPLRDYFDQLQKKLANRHKELPDDINEILNYMDDIYDETEEEAMQAVLREVALYPNTTNYNKIAQGFVDYVFLKPMQRVMGTARGNELFEMIQKAIIKYNKPDNTPRKRKATRFRPPLRINRMRIVTHYRKNFE